MIGRGTINRINRIAARRREIYRELEDESMLMDKRDRLIRELRDCEAETERLYGDLRMERSHAGRPEGTVAVNSPWPIIPMERHPRARKARLQW